MKKYIYPLIALSVTGMPFMAQASDGNVTVLADFFVSTCNLHTDSKNMTVALENAQLSGLKTPGATANTVPFFIKFTDCAPGSFVKVIFEGQASENDRATFILDNLQEDTSAKGIGLQIINGWNEVQQPNSNPSSYTGTYAGGDFSLSYKAFYKVLDNDVKPGEANVTVQYSVTYE